MRLESLKKDLEAIGKMFNESMRKHFEEKKWCDLEFGKSLNI